MENEAESNVEIAPSVNVLLPVCTESKDDVFLCILRSIVGRTGVDKHLLNNSLIKGMKMQTLQIEAEDVGHWKDLNSQSQQIRQAMMLGYWSIHNFPSLGNKLCGDTWKPCQRQCVRVVGRDPLTPDDFDTFIFAKMKLRIIQLYKNKDTLQRLKHFVTASIDLAKIDSRTQLSNKSKMVSYDVDSGVDHQCWNMLRSGAIGCVNVDDDESSDLNVQQLTAIEIDQQSSHSNVQMINATIEINQHSVVTPNKSHLAKRRRLHCATDNDTMTDVIDNSTTESLRTILAKMQSDLHSFTTWLNPRHDSEEDDTPQRVYLKIIAEKDETIARMKKNSADLQMQIDCLKNDNERLEGQCETNASVISALQKGVDAHFKLYVQSETQIIDLRNAINKQEGVISTKDKDLEVAGETISRLKKQINTVNNDADNIVPELNRGIEGLEQSLADSVEQNKVLNALVNEWKLYGESKDKALTETNIIVPGLKNEMEMLKKELADSVEQNKVLNALVNEWKLYGESKDKALTETNIIVPGLKNEIEMLKKELEESKLLVQHLEEQLKSLNIEVNSMLPKMKNDIESLESNLIDSITKNKNLDELLSESRMYGASKDQDIERMKLKADVLQKQMTNQIETLERRLTELTARNEELDVMLNELKICGGTKDKEQEKAKVLIDSLQDQMNSVNKDIERANKPENLSELAANSRNTCEITHSGKAACPIELNAEIMLPYPDFPLPEVFNSDNPTNPDFLLPEVDNSDNLISVFTDEADNDVQNPKHQNEYQVFDSDDPKVRACMSIVINQQFGWVKNLSKNSRAWPGFVCEPDNNGFARAQRITSDGYISNIKTRYAEFAENIDENEKGKAQVKALSKFNEKFKSNFI